MAERFTPFYEWAAKSRELTLAEALVLCRIKMWGAAGCFEKYSTLAERLKLGQRTIIRAVMSLRRRNVINVKYLDKAHQKRILIFNFDRTSLPIIDQGLMPQRHRNTAGEAETCATAAQVPVPQRHHTISCKRHKENMDETINLLGELLTTQKKPLHGQAFEKKRQEIKTDLFAAEAAARRK